MKTLPLGSAKSTSSPTICFWLVSRTTRWCCGSAPFDMIARSSTASFENVKRIGVCIIAGGRERSIRTLICHEPLASVTSGVLIA